MRNFKKKDLKLDHKELSLKYVEDLLSDSEKKNFEDHLKDCDDCKKHVDYFKNINTAVDNAACSKLKLESEDINKIMERINEESIEKESVTLFPRIRWALAVLIVLLGVFIFLFKGNITVPYYNFDVLSMKGNVSITDNRGSINKNTIKENDFIVTKNNSECYFTFSDNIFLLGQNTRLDIKKITKGQKGYKIVLRLHKGRILSNILNKKHLDKIIVKVDDIDVTITGTIFLIEKEENKKAKVSVLEGEVKVNELDKEYNVSEKKTFVHKKKVQLNPLNNITEEKFLKILDFSLYYKVNWKQKMSSFSDMYTVEDKKNLYFVNEDGRISVINKKTHHIEWQKSINGQVTALPVVKDKKLYINSSDGYLYAITDGKIEWKKHCGPFIYSSPVIHKNNCYTVNTKGEIYAITLKDKKLIWKTELSDQVFSTLMIKDDNIFIGTLSGVLYCLDKQDGEINWKQQLNRRIIDNPPVLYKDHLVIGTTSGDLYCIDYDDGDIIWSRKISEKISSPLQIKDKNIFVFGKNIHVYNLKGDKLWQRKLPSDSNVFLLKDEILVDDGRVLFLNYKTGALNRFYTKTSSMKIFVVQEKLFTYYNNYLTSVIQKKY